MNVLLLDIETAPGTAYVWSLYDDSVPVERVIAPSRMLCWAAKWLGRSGVHFGSEWGSGGADKMLKQLHALMSDADAVITYNGDKFDIPKITGAFVNAGLPPVPPVPSIDLYKTVKQLGYQSSKLAFVAPYLGIGEKVKHEGFSLWSKVLAGDETARKRMERYCCRDTKLLEPLYNKLRPFIRNHPYLGRGGRTECPACGGIKVQHRGQRRTKAFFIDRLHCQQCGNWSDGARRRAA